MNTSTLPRLVVSLTSPYARKVRIAALELGVPFVMVVDVPWNEDTGVIKLNPLGKVPVWVTAGGNAIADSRVIVEYLDTRSSARLFPGEPLDRIAVKQLEALADQASWMRRCACLPSEKSVRRNCNTPGGLIGSSAKYTVGLNISMLAYRVVDTSLGAASQSRTSRWPVLWAT